MVVGESLEDENAIDEVLEDGTDIQAEVLDDVKDIVDVENETERKLINHIPNYHLGWTLREPRQPYSEYPHIQELGSM